MNKVYSIAKEILQLKSEYPFTFIVNDFWQVAIEVGADGIHLGQDDLPLSEARKKVGSHMILGYSSHSKQEAIYAEKNGADYVALGAIFPTKTKGPGHPVVGIGMLRETVKILKIPLVAIGGINQQNFNKVKESGVAAIAMISALTLAPEVSQQARWFSDQFK